MSPFCYQSGVYTTLGTKNSEGLYSSYCPLLFIWVSGSIYPAMVTKLLLFVSISVSLKKLILNI